MLASGTYSYLCVFIYIEMLFCLCFYAKILFSGNDTDVCDLLFGDAHLFVFIHVLTLVSVCLGMYS